jgi:hypothetical protein
VDIDLSEDLLLVDNLDSATLKVEGAEDVSLDKCVVSEPYEYKELEPTGAQVLRSGILFVWPKHLNDQPPLGSVVVDEAGAYWTIWRLTYKQHVETWEAFCLNLSIVKGDRNAATILIASYGKGGANEAQATWRGLYSGKTTPTSDDTIPARFQPSEETALLEFGSEFTKEVYRVYFEVPAPINTAGGEYRLVDSDGYRYRVVRYFNEERIDKLPVAIAVRITEGAEYWAGSGV